MTVLDAHCDSPSQMYRLRDFSLDNPHAQVDFPKMKRGGITASFFAVYVPARMGTDEAWTYSNRLIDEVERQVAANSDSVAFARSVADLRENEAKGLVSVFLSLENGSAIGEDLGRLSHFYRRGVRYVTLTHSGDNQICDSCTGKGTWGGLSPFGRLLVPEMNRIGMLVDVAHCSDDTVRDVLALSAEPIAYTHGCCRSLCTHRRNLPDELIKGIAEKGGVMGMSIYPCFLSDSYRSMAEVSVLEDRLWIEDEFIADPGNAEKRAAWNSLKDEFELLDRPGTDCVAEHILHVAELCGIDHVGVGTDYDGIEVTTSGLEDISRFPALWKALEGRGFSSLDIEKVAGLNFVSLLERVGR